MENFLAFLLAIFLSYAVIRFIYLFVMCIFLSKSINDAVFIPWEWLFEKISKNKNE
jgi:hypothetical protein